MARWTGACLTATPELNFGEVYLFEEGLGEVQVSNCSVRDALRNVVVSEVQIVGRDGAPASDAFVIEEVERLPQVLGPGDQTAVTIAFRPRRAGPVEHAWLQIRHNVEEGIPALVALTGVPIENACPTARASCSLRSGGSTPTELLTAPLLSTVDCTSDRSSDPEGHLLEAHVWTLITPEGSRSLLNRVEGPVTSFFVDVPGTYEVGLDLSDELGMPACEPAGVLVESPAEHDE